ncbi:hypothetical protein B296_00027436 [Ensete ventricosum]|uniref:Uncharacterized protein n=1 Tax=Ensete ventricosum TaxID=4639 RepID=A0A427A5Z5_ENSVE|nr:hypothetical protein B296_00027436 [Ensete ventricosum]
MQVIDRQTEAARKSIVRMLPRQRDMEFILQRNEIVIPHLDQLTTLRLPQKVGQLIMMPRAPCPKSYHGGHTSPLPTIYKRALNLAQGLSILTIYKRALSLAQGLSVPTIYKRALSLTQGLSILTIYKQALSLAQGLSIPTIYKRAFSLAQGLSVLTIYKRAVSLAQGLSVPTIYKRALSLAQGLSIPTIYKLALGLAQGLLVLTIYKRALSLIQGFLVPTVYKQALGLTPGLTVPTLEQPSEGRKTRIRVTIGVPTPADLRLPTWSVSHASGPNPVQRSCRGHTTSSEETTGSPLKRLERIWNCVRHAKPAHHRTEAHLHLAHERRHRPRKARCREESRRCEPRTSPASTQSPRSGSRRPFEGEPTSVNVKRVNLLNAMKYGFWMTGSHSTPADKFNPNAHGINYSDVVAENVTMARKLAGIAKAPFHDICISNMEGFWMTGSHSMPADKFNPNAHGINYSDMVTKNVTMAKKLVGIAKAPFHDICISNMEGFWMTGSHSTPADKFNPNTHGINYSDVVAEKVTMVRKLAGIAKAPFHDICISNMEEQVLQSKYPLWNCTLHPWWVG